MTVSPTATTRPQRAARACRACCSAWCSVAPPACRSPTTFASTAPSQGAAQTLHVRSVAAPGCTCSHILLPPAPAVAAAAANQAKPQGLHVLMHQPFGQTQAGCPVGCQSIGSVFLSDSESGFKWDDTREFAAARPARTALVERGTAIVRDTAPVAAPELQFGPKST